MSMKLPAFFLTLPALLCVGLPATLKAVEAKDAVIYKDLIAPIMEAKCVACHGEEKQKGKLRLDSMEHLLSGSDGESVIPGNTKDSLVMFRVELPLDDSDHMPPEDEPQMTKEEIAVLNWWIEKGAKEDLKVAAASPTPELSKAIESVLAAAKAAAAAKPKEEEKAPAVELTEADKKAIAETVGRVEKGGATLQAIAQDTPQLRFSALNVAKDYKDADLKALEPVKNHVLWMDLARTQVTDAGLAAVGAMPNLSRLHLEHTGVTDAGLDHLKNLQKLEYLNLYNTKISDAGIQKLAGLKNLKKVFLWQTQVTPEGAKKLEAAIPGLAANMGWAASEPAAVVAKADAPKPATPAPAKPAEPAKPKAAPTPPAKPAEPAKAGNDLDKSIAAATQAATNAQKAAEAAAKAAEDARKAAETSKKVAEEAKALANKARESLDQLKKPAAADTPPKPPAEKK